MLGFGQDADQFGGIARMKRLGLAHFGFPEKSAEEVYHQIADMLYDSEAAVTARK